MVNLTAVQNLILVPEIFSVANTFSGGILGIMILVISFFGLIMLLITTFSKIDSFLSAAFITFVFSIFLFYLGLINDVIVGLVITLFIVSLGVGYMSKSSVGGV